MFRVLRDSAVITTLRMKLVGCAFGSHGIGPGKLIPFGGVFKRHQSSTDLVVVKDFSLSRILAYISQHLRAVPKRKGFFLVLNLDVG